MNGPAASTLGTDFISYLPTVGGEVKRGEDLGQLRGHGPSKWLVTRYDLRIQHEHGLFWSRCERLIAHKTYLLRFSLSFLKKKEMISHDKGARDKKIGKWKRPR